MSAPFWNGILADHANNNAIAANVTAEDVLLRRAYDFGRVQINVRDGIDALEHGDTARALECLRRADEIGRAA